MKTWDSQMWMGLMQIAFISVILLVSNIIRRKIPFLRKSLLPTAVIGGFLALGAKYIVYAIWGNGTFINEDFMSAITYHTLGIGFIALTLKAAEKKPTNAQRTRTVKSGLFIVTTYIMQCLLGIAVTIFISWAFFPGLFEGSGVLLMLGFGQGPGQAGNIGTIYEEAGKFGMHSFALAVASIGFVWACIPGVIYLNYLLRKGKIKKPDATPPEQMQISTFVDENEIPHTEAIDKMTVQIALVLMIYALTYLFMYGIDAIVKSDVLGSFGTDTVRPIVWGFNFLWAILVSFCAKFVIRGLRKTKLMNRQYTNNYILNRIGGLAFDFMIVASICAIDVNDLTANNLWLPLLILTTVGGVVTFFLILFASKRVYPQYPVEGMISMYGMLTGTVSTGMILLREIDPEFKTPAADNLIFGSTSAIALGAPLLLLLNMVTTNIWLFAGIVTVLFVLYTFFLFYEFPNRRKPLAEGAGAEAGDGTSAEAAVSTNVAESANDGSKAES